MKKVTGTKLGIVVIVGFFLLQCEVVDAPVHEVKKLKMYYDAPLREEIERTA